MSYHWKLKVGQPRKKWREKDHPRDEVGRFAEKDVPVVRVTVKGGPGSGNFGHTGRPGQVGGSGPGGVSVAFGPSKALSLFGVSTREPTSAEREKITGTIANVVKAVPSFQGDEVLVTVVDGEIRNNSPIGVRTKEGIAVAPDVMEKYAREKTFGPDWLGWDQSESVTKDSLLEHTVAHEMGHRWYLRQNKAIYGTNERGERTKRVEVGKKVKEWREISKNKRISGYSTYYRDDGEAFADAFAHFVLGRSMDSSIEDWFWENVK